jgi:hypothetical protein
MTRYKLLLGVTAPTLEVEINNMVSNDSSAKLLGAFFAQGSGFFGVMEYDGEEQEAAQVHKKAKAAEAHPKTKAEEHHHKTKARK